QGSGRRPEGQRGLLPACPSAGYAWNPSALSPPPAFMSAPLPIINPARGGAGLPGAPPPARSPVFSPSVALDQDALGRAFQLDGVGFDGEPGSGFMAGSSWWHHR